MGGTALTQAALGPAPPPVARPPLRSAQVMRAKWACPAGMRALRRHSCCSMRGRDSGNWSRSTSDTPAGLRSPLFLKERRGAAVCIAQRLREVFSDSTRTPPETLEAEVEASLCGSLFFFLLDFCRGTAGFSVLPQCSSGPGVWLCVWPPPAPLQTVAQQVIFFFFLLIQKITVFSLLLKVSSMRLCKFWRRGKFTDNIPYLLVIGHEYKLW